MRRTKKEIIISQIRQIIEETGSFGRPDMESASICVGTLGNLSAFAENFNDTDVNVIVYNQQGEIVDEYDADYVDLSVDDLQEILFIADLHLIDWDKTMERCRG